MRESTSREKVAKEMLFGTFSGNSATKYAIAHENMAKEELEKVIEDKIEAASLFVNPEISFLACSPDGLVGKDAVVEIKCPISARTITPEERIVLKTIKSCQIEDSQLRLKRNNNYFYQIQGQLHITWKSLCYFCIWTPKGLMFEKIKRDDNFWKKKMEPQLKIFYINYLLPEILKEKLL